MATTAPAPSEEARGAPTAEMGARMPWEVKASRRRGSSKSMGLSLRARLAERVSNQARTPGFSRK